jgi:hypothetical protein
MSQKNDIELKKAALVIAKLLMRTREGKILWKNDNLVRAAVAGPLKSSNEPPPLGGLSEFSPAWRPSAPFVFLYTATLEDEIEAVLSRDDQKIGFRLSGPPAVKIPSGGLYQAHKNKEILSLSLSHSFGKEERFSPESIVYRDLEELIHLAENPKSVSDDLRLKQVMSYLEKLAV